MLKTLDEWRARCSNDALRGFEAALLPVCADAIRPNALRTRYDNSLHKALSNAKVMKAAIETAVFLPGRHPWDAKVNAGKHLCQRLADNDGAMPKRKVGLEYSQSVQSLLQRGVIFDHQEHYCLPVELVFELRGDSHPRRWLTLVANTPAALLDTLVPESAQADMQRPKALRVELGAWLSLAGWRALKQKKELIKQLDGEDWALLLAAERAKIDTFEEVQSFFPGLEPAYISFDYYFDRRERLSLLESLKAAMPQRLQKLSRLGLIGIETLNGNRLHAAIVLSDEGRALLKPHLKRARAELAASIADQWEATGCQARAPSPWSMDQDIWRLWVIAHFVPPGLTKQQLLRKNDLKKVAKLMVVDDVARIEFLLMSMSASGLLAQKGDHLVPEAINWAAWVKQQQASIHAILGHGHAWGKGQEKAANALLAKLPVGRWLKLGAVVQWLRLHAEGELAEANWRDLFVEYQYYALHDFDQRQDGIYLLPAFHAVVKGETVHFPAPGWHGAEGKAKIHGYINAAGEIQLPPDCSSKVFEKLAPFCRLTAIAQMITLQIDRAALQRMGGDKRALNRTRKVLESIQSPLPQAVAYLFEKQKAQKAIATAAATSMVLILKDPAALNQLHKLGFTLTQPFDDRPELVLLDAAADAHAFVTQCADKGVLLDTVVKPVKWISGTPSMTAWMEAEQFRGGQWVEVCYQKTRSGKPKQVLAIIRDCWYGGISVVGVKKSRQGQVLQKKAITLEPKHILRLRELDDAEVTELGLDKLS